MQCDILRMQPERCLSFSGVAELCERLHHFKQTNIPPRCNRGQGYLDLNIGWGQHLMRYKSPKGKRETLSNQFLSAHFIYEDLSVMGWAHRVLQYLWQPIHYWCFCIHQSSCNVWKLQYYCRQLSLWAVRLFFYIPVWNKELLCLILK